ncbi:GntR family transcriptional regulator [Phytoactinopolyspora limicola]|uniref:GntR family transcriptional regulator n=1 Tax=Phytoactinopolyspora limicola TaxID=2715536 RepID=UPI001A9CB5CC
MAPDDDRRPASRLPGERDLATDYGVSIGTVRRATDVLREQGLLVTLPAKGTYVQGKAGADSTH